MHGVSVHLIDSIGDFLEAAVHQVLFGKQLYTSELFERSKYFGFTARRSRHPGLNSYISQTINRVKPLLHSHSLQEFCIVFSDPHGTPIERVSFLFKLLDPLAPGSIDIEALQSAFSSILLSFTCSVPIVKPLAKGSTFELVVYSSSREGIDYNYFSEDNTRSIELCDSTSQQGLTAHPIKKISVPGCLRAQVLLEQIGEK